MLRDKLNELTDVKWMDFDASHAIDWNKTQVFKIDVKDYYQRISPSFEQVLSEEEIKKSKAFSRIVDTERHISARHAIREIVSLCAGCDPASVIFSQSEHKKPLTAKIQFNISHSHNCILIALSNAPLGVDVEYVKDFDMESLFRYCFDDQEVSQIQNAQNKKSAFYALWTRKEATLKASGEGLVENLLEINCLQKRIQRLGIDYHLSSWKLDKDYIFSLATSLDSEKEFWVY